MCVLECMYLLAPCVCCSPQRSEDEADSLTNVVESCELALSVKKSNQGPLQSNKHSQLMNHLFSPGFTSFYTYFGLAFEVTAP